MLLYVMMLLNTVAPQSGHQWTMLGEWKMHRHTQQSMKEEYTGLEPQTSITTMNPLHHTKTEIYY